MLKEKSRGFFSDFRKQLTIGALVGGVAASILIGSFGFWTDRLTGYGRDMVDSVVCQGRAAMAEGDRLSELAIGTPANAQAHFQSANAQYRVAYDCGFADAGLRLAVAHCMGLGTPKDPRRARQLVLDVEGKYPEKVGRAADVRKACGL